MADLLPCPFCGNEPRVFPINPKRDGDAWTAIECANCASDQMGEQSVVRVAVYADSGHRERAIILWNTRTPPIDVEAVALNALINLVDACEQRRVEDFDPNSRVTVLETRTKDILAFHEALDEAQAAITAMHANEEKS